MLGLSDGLRGGALGLGSKTGSGDGAGASGHPAESLA